MVNLSDRIITLQEEIVVRVEAIDSQKEDKKVMQASYNENIKGLEVEKAALIQELNATKEEVKRVDLVGQADDLIAASAAPNDEDLSLVV